MKQEENALTEIAKQLDIKLEIHKQNIEDHKNDLMIFGIDEKDAPFNKMYSWEMYKEFMVPSSKLLPTSLEIRSDLFTALDSRPKNKKYTHQMSYYLDINIGEKIRIKGGKYSIYLSKNGQEQKVKDKKLKKQLRMIIHDSYSFLENKQYKTFNFMLNPFPLIRTYIKNNKI